MKQNKLKLLNNFSDYLSWVFFSILARFPLLRFRSALHCSYSGITDIQDGLFFVLTRARELPRTRAYFFTLFLFFSLSRPPTLMSKNRNPTK
jgi:hypothetical protein